MTHFANTFARTSALGSASVLRVIPELIAAKPSFADDIAAYIPYQRSSAAPAYPQAGLLSCSARGSEEISRIPQFPHEHDIPSPKVPMNQLLPAK